MQRPVRQYEYSIAELPALKKKCTYVVRKHICEKMFFVAIYHNFVLHCYDFRDCNMFLSRPRFPVQVMNFINGVHTEKILMDLGFTIRT